MEHPFLLNQKIFKPLSLNKSVFGEKTASSTCLPQKSNAAVLKSNNTLNLPSNTNIDLEKNSIQATNNNGISNFTTCRLKPIIQQTKTGQIEITRHLEVLMEFKSDANVTGISGDGTRISIYRRLQNRVVDISNPISVYDINSLPTGYHKKIRYASRFVELVRAKTPKVINPN